MIKNTILNVDCVKGMKNEISDGEIDLVLADPPYVISRPSQFGSMPDRKKPRTGTNFGQWDKKFNNLPWLKECYRVLKKGGSLIVFNDIKKITNIIQQTESLGFKYKDTLIWNKTNPMPRNTERRYVQDIEIAIWFVKVGAPWTFNRTRSPYLSCVRKYPTESGGGFKRIHPTQKPIKLISSLIKVHSKKGDLVLDPFMGSGTTAISCLENDRFYCGFEIDKNYFRAMMKRIEEFKNKSV